MTDWGYTPNHTISHTISQFSTYIFSADITPEMLKLGTATKVKVFFLVLVYDFNIDLLEFSAAILEKDLSLHTAAEPAVHAAVKN